MSVSTKDFVEISSVTMCRAFERWGWAGKKNGELLTLAVQCFQVFITVDRNLYFQQNLSKINIAVVILVAKSNHVIDLRPLASQVLEQLATLVAGDVRIIGAK